MLKALKRFEEIKHAEAELRESEKKFKSLVEHSLVGVYLIQNGVFKYVNPKLAEIFGYSQDVLIDKKGPQDLVYPEDWPIVKENLRRRLEGEIESINYSFRGRKKTGKPFDVEVFGSRTLYRGQPAVIGTLLDITERKQAEKRLKRSLEKQQRIIREIIHAMASIVEIKDLYTAGHQRGVSKLATAIAKEMGLSEKQIEAIAMAGAIHDIGKICVPAEILAKPSRLTEMEFNIVKSHPEMSYEILKPIEFPYPLAAIVLQHHERMDGSGYPLGLCDEDILLEARILAVADVVEAMSSHRPYRPTLGINKALQEISKGRGILYDPDVVDACLRLFTKKKFKFK